MANTEKNYTLWGWLSFPTLTAAEAYALSQKGTYPSADVASSAPHFQLLLSDAQWDAFEKHVVTQFLPYCEAQHAKGEKKDALDKKEVAALIEAFTGEPGSSPYNTPVKVINEKTAALRPDAVRAIKVAGGKGSDFEIKAIVNDDTELSVPDPDILDFPKVLPINRTTHKLYAGCRVAVTINLYAYHNGKLAGFSAGANTLVFKADDTKFGGGVDVDEDAIFMD
jgi:hypothetical protein